MRRNVNYLLAIISTGDKNLRTDYLCSSVASVSPPWSYAPAFRNISL